MRPISDRSTACYRWLKIIFRPAASKMLTWERFDGVEGAKWVISNWIREPHLVVTGVRHLAHTYWFLRAWCTHNKVAYRRGRNGFRSRADILRHHKTLSAGAEKTLRTVFAIGTHRKLVARYTTRANYFDWLMRPPIGSLRRSRSWDGASHWPKRPRSWLVDALAHSEAAVTATAALQFNF